MLINVKQFFRRWWKIITPAGIALLTLFVSLFVNLDITSDWEGLYLLTGPGRTLTLTDDLFPEDTESLVAGAPFTWISNAITAGSCSAASSCLSTKWDEEQGRGYVKNYFQDGRKLLINLSRFKNEEGALSSGIFLGGGLPPTDPDFKAKNKDGTGMSYFDGERWFHIWCSVNEGILPAVGEGQPIYPQQWKFLGSRILENSSNNISIVSSHWLSVDNVPLLVEKYFFYETGDYYFTLITRIKNEGVRPVSFYYLYGDEPWVGHFGSARGNVGWTKDGFYKTEGPVDTRTNTFVGLLDYGNDLAGESHRYTGKANFIEWDRATAPDMAYFSNLAGRYSQNGSIRQPLNSPDTRFIGLEWARTLKPGQASHFTMAVGMAINNPKTGLPLKPVTRLN